MNNERLRIIEKLISNPKVFKGTTYDPIEYAKEYMIEKYCMHSDYIDFIDWCAIYDMVKREHLMFVYIEGYVIVSKLL